MGSFGAGGGPFGGGMGAGGVPTGARGPTGSTSTHKAPDIDID